MKKIDLSAIAVDCARRSCERPLSGL